MIQILRKPGWVLNPNDKVVNAILKRCEMNNGECPCHNESEDKRCPCSSYREHNVCHCNLYIPTEIWKPVSDFMGFYEISNFGRVRNVNTGRVLKPFKYRGGYMEYHLRKPGIKIHKKVHRLVAEHFLDNPNNYPEVNHKDENRINNVFTNLEWCNRSYNNTYNNRHIKVGKKHWKSVSAYTINGELVETFNSETAAAQKFQVSQGRIANAVISGKPSVGGYIWKLNTK